MLGWGTFMLRKAAGSEAHIVVVSPDSPEMVAKNANRGERFWIDWIGPSTYLTEEKFVDFDAIDWLEIGIDTPEKKRATLVYFDDHQSGYRRLLEAERAGFEHVMYDDGYPWPGDNYALKQACDRTGYLDDVRDALKSGYSDLSQLIDMPARDFFSYRDDFGAFSGRISAEQKECIQHDMLQRLDIYYEFPPMWPGGFREGNSSPILESIRQKALLTIDEGEAFLKSFRHLRLITTDEARRYTFFTYAKIRAATSTLPIQKDCLAGVDMPLKYRVTRGTQASTLSRRPAPMATSH
jgi:hypothetical protein